MANEARKAILRALIENVLYELHPKTVADNVWLDSVTTVAAKLSEMVTAINLRAKSTDVTTEITNAISGLRTEMLGDVPVEAYNTFTELAAYIAEHKEVADALTSAIGDKADKDTVAALQAAVEGLQAQGNHSHANKAVLDGITSAKVAEWNGKGRFIPSATRPADLKNGDLWAELI